MKRILSILVCAIVAVMAFAQESATEVAKTMCVYRNDGDFNAFFVDEIDSITYSTFGYNGVRYNDPEVEVIWTADSVYRIPVEVIDSISFTRPETKLNSDVVMIDATWFEHIVNVNDLTITFRMSITNIWNPENGVILAYLLSDQTFPDGFAGRVISVNHTSGLIVVECEEVGFEDIWESLFIYGDIEQDGQASSAPARRLDWDWSFFTMAVDTTATFETTLQANYEYNRGPFTLNIVGAIRLTARVLIVKGPNLPFKIDIRFSDKEVANISAELEYEIEETKIKPSVPIAYGSKDIWAGYMPTGFSLFAEVYPCIEYGFNSSFQAALTAKSRSDARMWFVDDEWHFDYPERRWEVTPTLEISAEGFVGAGYEVDFGVKWVRNLIKAKVAVTGTAGLSTDTEIDLLQEPENYAYNVFKDAKIESYAKAAFDLKWHMKIPFTNKVFDGDTALCEPLQTTLDEWYLFPKFSRPLLIKRDNDKNLQVRSNISRSLLLPVQVGFNMVYEDENELLHTRSLYEETTYRNAQRVIDLTFEDCERERCYSIYPTFRLLGLEIQADPKNEVCLYCPITGAWTCTGYSRQTSTQLQSMTLNANGSWRRVYYYSSTGETRTFTSGHYTYDPDTKEFVMYKTDDDIQYWHVTRLDDHHLTLTSDIDGFEYYFTR